MIELKQHDGAQLFFETAPKKIISLVPSVTETMLQWGKVPIARTQFCIYPQAQVDKIPTVKGTKNPDLAQIMSFTPDLIVANKEENRREDIEALEKHCPVWVTYPHNIDSTLSYMQELAQLCPNTEQSTQDMASMAAFFSEHKVKSTHKVACFIWKKPWMVAGGNTYISSLIEYCSNNVFAEQMRYPEIELDDLIKLNVDQVFLLTEPFCFNDTHKHEFEDFFEKHGYKAQVDVMNGEDFTWPGRRAVKAIQAMQQVLKQ